MILKQVVSSPRLFPVLLPAEPDADIVIDTTSLAQSKRGKTAKADSRPVKFVNVTRPARFDRKTKRNVRTPVNRDPQHRKHGEENLVSAEVGFATGKRTKDLPLQATPTLRQPAYPTFPIKMESYMYSLVEQCKCPLLIFSV